MISIRQGAVFVLKLLAALIIGPIALAGLLLLIAIAGIGTGVAWLFGVRVEIRKNSVVVGHVRWFTYYPKRG